MEDAKLKKFIVRLKKRLPLLIFLAIATIAYFLASTLLLDDSYKDIIFITMIWALPLFIH
ncbi:hypothetical protein [Fibrobacter sp. UWR2]|jgi:hypothetical protein|uniref:hypothetical protein n=1 Tax=Fibrobacter sp. UWR2 TaxID=1964352 RepID=UPI000B520C44|nr:hypothetical protein [Fibrobacter sp. UWR2]OWV02083.1 hypothetical protein B7994_02415 [Fibrobacter sp. UWR2]